MLGGIKNIVFALKNVSLVFKVVRISFFHHSRLLDTHTTAGLLVNAMTIVQLQLFAVNLNITKMHIWKTCHIVPFISFKRVGWPDLFCVFLLLAYHKLQEWKASGNSYAYRKQSLRSYLGIVLYIKWIDLYIDVLTNLTLILTLILAVLIQLKITHYISRIWFFSRI